MTTVNVIDRDGMEHQLQVRTGAALMTVLRDQDMGVAALCGGICSCATCHIYVDDAWYGKLKPPQSDETEILNDTPDRLPNSRLSCQIRLEVAHDGLKVTIAPDG